MSKKSIFFTFSIFRILGVYLEVGYEDVEQLFDVFVGAVCLAVGVVDLSLSLVVLDKRKRAHEDVSLVVDEAQLPVLELLNLTEEA